MHSAHSKTIPLQITANALLYALAKGKAKEKPPSKKSVVVESPRSEDHEEEHVSVHSGSEDKDRTR